MPEGGPRRVVRRARTAAALPGRVVAVEDRCVALETHVVAKLDEMREELAELRLLLRTVVESEGDLAGLVGRLLAKSEERMDSLEASVRGAGADVEASTSVADGSGTC